LAIEADYSANCRASARNRRQSRHQPVEHLRHDARVILARAHLNGPAKPFLHLHDELSARGAIVTDEMLALRAFRDAPVMQD
jgi:hypothetical protein